jgi:SAM-dependent methyltransferase
MKAELTDLICCPQCGGTLQPSEIEIKDDEIWQGALTCSHCSVDYPIQKGLPHLYVNDENWAPKAAEAEGWVTYHKDLGIYEIAPDSVDLQIPYYPEEPWIKVARSFDIALAELNLTGTETILDLGAGRGWAAKEFAKRGCRVVALDVVPDENVGLGRAKALMDHAGVYFDRVLGDGEKLPFFADSFDLVFCAAALHHSSNLPLFLENIHKVLKRNGRLCAINEPCISITNNEQKILARHAAHELELGINETRPNLIEYEQALRHAGLHPLKLAPAHGMTLHADDLLIMSRNLGAVRPHPTLIFTEPARFIRQIGKYIMLRLAALNRGVYSQAQQFIATHQETQVETAFLLWGGGELFLLAIKP